ncbi:MAG: FAD-dependent oxidoreductase [Deltaproteobacteria bacterium]|jgi:nitrite reductase (NADH) large subunit|nr:FAD-dependent oxidoreductase [Deltaproteobacteria bacterium]
MNIVIAGAGVAGITAAETARAADPKANITIFSQERERLYYRPRLPEVVAGKVPMDKIFANPEGWFLEKNLEFRAGESLVDICLDTHQVRGSLGSRLIYDRLLLATGAESAKPPWPGVDLPGVYAVRSLNDAVSLYYDAGRAKEAILVGSGLLGLEMGNALITRGLKTRVIERGTRVLPRQTTPKSGAKLLQVLTKLGFEILLGQEVQHAYGQDRLEGVVLKSGQEARGQILILATGIKPNLDLAKLIKLKTDKAIVVDEYLETSLPGVYAAGDCAQSPDGFSGLWTISRLQGLTAGANLVAQDAASRKIYEAQPPSTLLKVAGIDLIAAGNIDPDGQLTGLEAEDENAYRKLLLDPKGLLVGFTILGTKAGNRELNEALGQKIIPSELWEPLKSLDFDFAKIKALPKESGATS